MTRTVATDDNGTPTWPAAEDLPHSSIRVVYEAVGGRTFASRTYEHGSLRLRHPRGPTCRGVLINTGGGVVGGDRLAIEVALGPCAAVALTSSAAEKIYRSDGPTSTMSMKLELASRSALTWLPQETILFDHVRLRRDFDIRLGTGASLFAAEIVVFGRTAYGERDIEGHFRDSWRLRRDGRLVFADETRIEGQLSAVLADRVVANGARAVATVLVASPEAPHLLDGVRAAIASYAETAAGRIDGAATLRDDLIIARLLADSPERLRAVVAAMLGVGRVAAYRDWL